MSVIKNIFQSVIIVGVILLVGCKDDFETYKKVRTVRNNTEYVIDVVYYYQNVFDTTFTLSPFGSNTLESECFKDRGHEMCGDGITELSHDDFRNVDSLGFVFKKPFDRKPLRILWLCTKRFQPCFADNKTNFMNRRVPSEEGSAYTILNEEFEAATMID